MISLVNNAGLVKGIERVGGKSQPIIALIQQRLVNPF